MNWTPLHDLVLCKEIIFVNPYGAKKKFIQRIVLWQKIAENLNSVKDPCFIVEKRSVRDHIAILIQRFKRQQAQEWRESGTTPQHTELDTAIEQIIANHCSGTGRPKIGITSLESCQRTDMRMQSAVEGYIGPPNLRKLCLDHI